MTVPSIHHVRLLLMLTLLSVFIINVCASQRDIHSAMKDAADTKLQKTDSNTKQEKKSPSNSVLKKVLTFVGTALLSLSHTARALPVDEAKIEVIDHWQNLNGIVSLRPSPVSDHVFVLLRDGEVRVYDSWAIDAPNRVLFSLGEQVFSWWDRASTAFELHPDFSVDYPYAFMLYAAEPSEPWNDNCERSDSDGRLYCESNSRLMRIKLNYDDFTMDDIDQILVDMSCSSSPSHHVGDMRFLNDGSLVFSTGDGAQFVGVDYGTSFDQCFEPEDSDLQGAFRAMRDDFEQGKIYRIPSSSLLLDRLLIPGEDFESIAKGMRNPFRMTVDPVTNDVLFGDVGLTSFEEINRILDPLSSASYPHDFGWPCREGPDPQSQYYDLAAALSSSLCDAQGVTEEPLVAYRDNPVDTENIELCTSGSSSTSGLTIYTGSLLGPEYQNALFFIDGPKACAWWLPRDASGFDTSRLRTFLFDTGFVVDIVESNDGDLYLAVYGEGKVIKVTSTTDTTSSSANNSPQAALSVSTTNGASPLTVEFDASSSVDADDDVLIYSWDVDGDGNTDAITQDSTFTYVYSNSGIFRARVTVTDSGGLSDERDVDIVVDSPIDIVVTPASGTWCLSDTLQYSLILDSSSTVTNIEWSLQALHCELNELDESSCHTHALSLNDDSEDFSGTFNAIPHGMPTSLQLQLMIELDNLGSYTQIVTTQPLSYTLFVQTSPPLLPRTVEGVTCIDSICPIQAMCGSHTVIQIAESIVDTALVFSHWDIIETIDGVEVTSQSTTLLYDEMARGETSLTAVYEEVEDNSPTEIPVAEPSGLCHWSCSDVTPCYTDAACAEGGLGCNVGGIELCRFCEFGPLYMSIVCQKDI